LKEEAKTNLILKKSNLKTKSVSRLTVTKYGAVDEMNGTTDRKK
jgi:hypothetical protein